MASPQLSQLVEHETLMYKFKNVIRNAQFLQVGHERGVKGLKIRQA